MSREETIKNYMQKLHITEEEAIELWNCDNGLDSNEEQEVLTQKSKNAKISHGASGEEVKTERKPRTPKKVAEKSEVFNVVLSALTEKYGENADVITEDKLILVHINGKVIKIDLVDHTKSYNKK